VLRTSTATSLAKPLSSSKAQPVKPPRRHQPKIEAGKTGSTSVCFRLPYVQDSASATLIAARARGFLYCWQQLRLSVEHTHHLGPTPTKHSRLTARVAYAMQHTQRMHTHLQHLPHANSNISHTCGKQAQRMWSQNRTLHARIISHTCRQNKTPLSHTVITLGPPTSPP
jgi:hypothetical protein